MHAKYEVSISSKVIAQVKVDNRQTDRQDKNNMPPTIQSGGIKMYYTSVPLDACGAIKSKERQKLTLLSQLQLLFNITFCWRLYVALFVMCVQLL